MLIVKDMSSKNKDICFDKGKLQRRDTSRITIGIVIGLILLGVFIVSSPISTQSILQLIRVKERSTETINVTSGPSVNMTFDLGLMELNPILKFNRLNVTEANGLIYMNTPAYYVPTSSPVLYLQQFNFTQNQNVSLIFVYVYGEDGGEGLAASIYDENDIEISQIDIDSSGFNWAGQAVNILNQTMYFLANRSYYFVLSSSIDHSAEFFITLESYYYYNRIGYRWASSVDLDVDTGGSNMWVLSNSFTYGALMINNTGNYSIPDIFMCIVNSSAGNIHPVVIIQNYFFWLGFFVDVAEFLDSGFGDTFEIGFSHIRASLICTNVSVTTPADSAHFIVGAESKSIVNGSYIVSETFSKNTDYFEIFFLIESGDLFAITIDNLKIRFEFL